MTPSQPIVARSARSICAVALSTSAFLPNRRRNQYQLGRVIPMWPRLPERSHLPQCGATCLHGRVDHDLGKAIGLRGIAPTLQASTQLGFTFRSTRSDLANPCSIALSFRASQNAIKSSCSSGRYGIVGIVCIQLGRAATALSQEIEIGMGGGEEMPKIRILPDLVFWLLV